jgi:hypothetical protein
VPLVATVDMGVRWRDWIAETLVIQAHTYINEHTVAIFGFAIVG